MQPEKITNLFSVLYQTFSSDYFIVAVVLILLDFTTGLLKSFINHNTNSSIGLKGFSKHFGVLLVIITIISIYFFDSNLYTSFSLYTFVIYLYIFYLISIIENLDEIGVPIPTYIKNLINNEKDKIDKK